jgi:uncharacterized protein YjdB
MALTAMVCAFGMASFVSCGGGSKGGGAVAVTGMTVTPKVLSVAVGATKSLTAEVEPPGATDKTVTWFSADMHKATVSTTGAVTGVAEGTTTITATTNDGAMTDTCEVTVTALSVPVTDVTMVPATLALVAGGHPATGSLTATIAPPGATNKAVTWASDAVGVATVSGAGLTATVTAVAPGKAKITVETADGGKTAECTVTVAAPPLDELAIFVAGVFGLYIDGNFDEAIGRQMLWDVAVDDASNVHAVGFYEEPGSQPGSPLEASHYLNDVATVLPRTLPNGVETLASGVAAGNGHVYIAGYEIANDATGDYQVARLWVDDQISNTLQGTDQGGRPYSIARAVKLSGPDVYVAGGVVEDGGWRPAIWKNGVKHSYPDYNTFFVGLGIADDGKVYGLGPANSGVYSISADLGAIAPYPVQNDATKLHMSVDGNDVYIAGRHDAEASYWKNGVRYDIEHPATAYGNTVSYVEAHSILAYDGHLYIAGRASTSGGYMVFTWIDGVWISDARGIAATFDYGHSQPHAIHAKHVNKVPVAGVSLDKQTAVIPVGYTDTLTATVVPSNAFNKRINWTTSDPSVATITGSGLTVAINGLTPGTATITAAADGGFTANCSVTVQTVSVTDITLAPTSASIVLGRTAALTATIQPPTATDKHVIWTTSDPTVATPQGSGLTCMVTATGFGSAVIPATTQDGGCTAVCSVNVVPAGLTNEPAIFLAGGYGLYVDGIKSDAIGSHPLFDVAVDAAGTVHAPGELYNEDYGIYQATYFRDGAPTALQLLHGTDAYRSIAHSIALSGGDVYIAGYEDFAGGPWEEGVAARLWKNSANVPLDGADESGTDWTFALAVRTRNSDVWIGGLDYPGYGSPLPCFWKNGSLRTVYDESLQGYEVFDFCFAPSGLIYAILSVEMADPIYGHAYNMVVAVNPDNVSDWQWLFGGDYYSIPLHISADGPDVYVAGWYYPDTGASYACYWKNGVKYQLTPPAGAVRTVQADDVYVHGGHLYVAGASNYPSSPSHPGGFNRITQWIDGAVITDRAADDAVAYRTEGMCVQSVDRVPVTAVNVAPAALTVAPGYTGQLTASVSPADAFNKTIVWSTDSPSVATVVGSGLTATVTGGAGGTATIRATSVNGPSAACAVTVQMVAVTGLTIAPESLAIAINHYGAIVATIAPETATNKNITWISGNPNIATVSGDSLIGTVRGVAGGSTTITATTQDGGFSKVCSVTVTAGAADPVVFVASAFGLYADGAFFAPIGSQHIHDVFVDDAHIHAAGQYFDPAGPISRNACYFRDDAKTILPVFGNSAESCAFGIEVGPNGDIYIAGQDIRTNQSQSATLWKSTDGGLTFAKSPLDGAESANSRADAVRIHNGSVYAAGGVTDGGTMYPAIWKDGAKHTITNMSYRYFSHLGIAADGRVLVFAYRSLSGGTAPFDGIYLLSADLDSATAYFVPVLPYWPGMMCVDGNDAYMAGWRGQDACYWKNGGSPIDLPRPAGAVWVEADAIYAHGGHIYVAGRGRDNGDIFRIYTWVDGVSLSGPGAVTDAFENLITISITSIFAK